MALKRRPWINLLERAKEHANTRVSERLRNAGHQAGEVLARRVSPSVARRLTGAVAMVSEFLAGGPGRPQSRPPRSGAPDNTAEPGQTALEGRLEDALARVSARADRGLKPEDRVVVIYATSAESDQVAALRHSFSGVEATIRQMDLDREPPQTKRQMATLTGVMQPPYVYINGRYWGGPYEIEHLRMLGELENVVANILDELSPAARRMGRLHDEFRDDIDVANIVARWKLGHILCVDDLDSWYEVDRRGAEHFYYQGTERSVATMPAVAREIAAAVENGSSQANWLLEPSVSV